MSDCDEEIPIACTLAPEVMGQRLGDWHALLAYVECRVRVDEGIRLELAGDAPVHELARLVVAEQACCRFFRFAITVDDRGLALEVRAPDEARAIVDGLFGGQERF